MSKKILITDANGKSFEVSMSEIKDMVIEDSAIEVNPDSTSESNITHMKAFDAEGNTIDLSTISDSDKEDKDKLPKALDVTFEATHSGQNKNDVIYHSDSMEKDTATWRVPYAKPLIKNHDVHQEPLGRVIDALFRPAKLVQDRDCIEVTFRVTDQDAIQKFIDGRYRTMSIGGSVGHIQCNICGKDILKDGVFKFCGHWKGEVYNNQKSIWSCRDIEYKEGSIVNTPADVWAQVVNTKPASDTADNENVEATNMDNETLQDIDNLIGQDNSNEQGTEDATDNTENSADNIATNNDSTLDDEALKSQISALEAKVKELEDSLQVANDKVASLTTGLEVADNDAKTSRQQAVKLAVLNKELMAKRISDRLVLSGELKVTDYDSKVKELLSKPAKELRDSLTDIKTVTPHVVPPAQSPGAVNNNASSTVQEDNNEKKKLTLKEFEDSMF